MQRIKVWMAFYHKMSFDKIYIFRGVFSSSSVDYLHLISKWFSVYNYQILTFRVSERVCVCVCMFTVYETCDSTTVASQIFYAQSFFR